MGWDGGEEGGGGGRVGDPTLGAAPSAEGDPGCPPLVGGGGLWGEHPAGVTALPVAWQHVMDDVRDKWCCLCQLSWCLAAPPAPRGGHQRGPGGPAPSVRRSGPPAGAGVEQHPLHLQGSAPPPAAASPLRPSGRPPSPQIRPHGDTEVAVKELCGFRGHRGGLGGGLVALTVPPPQPSAMTAIRRRRTCRRRSAQRATSSPPRWRS